MATSDVALENRTNSVLPSSLILLDPIHPTSIGSKDRRAIPATSNTTRSDEAVRSCMRHLPPVPPGYDFSIQQRVKQFLYFKNQYDINHYQNPAMDLFNVAILAVCKSCPLLIVVSLYTPLLVPDDASEAVRRFVEALFITHAETKLNTSGRLLHLDDADDDSYTAENHKDNPNDDSILREKQVLDREEWCLNLVFPHQRS